MAEPARRLGARAAGAAKRVPSGEEGNFGSLLGSRCGPSGEAVLVASDSRKKAKLAVAGISLHPAAELDAMQAELVAKFVQSIDPNKESIVISNPRAKGNPIIWVSPPWQDMCGYSYDEAVGRNPRMTQGEGTDPHVVRAISSALGEHRACKVQLLNYRGGSSDRPFWNMLTMSPLHHRGELQLFVANLQDYSYHIGKMVSLTPAQFCRAPSHYQRGRRFTGERLGTLMLAKPAIYEADEAFPIAEAAAQPSMPAPVKRLGWSKLQLEPEHLADRLADVFESIDGCRYEIRQRGTDESDAAIVCAEHDGVAIRVIVAEEPDGQYSIACTRISGNTFAYHSTFRILRERLGHALTEHPLVLPMTDGARRRGDGGGAGIGLAAVPVQGRV